MNPWTYKYTPCYPNCWKVFPQYIYGETNDTGNYFATEEEAKEEVKRRNLEHQRCIEKRYQDPFAVS